MSSLFANLGINWKLLVAQVINFAILAFILQHFLYRPLIKLLDGRREEIKKAHQASKDIEKRLADIDTAKEAVLADARVKSTEIIKHAEAGAKTEGQRILAEAKADSERLMAEEKVKLEREREKLMQDAARELGDTVSSAVEKSMGDVLDEKARGKLVADAMKVAGAVKHR